MATKKRYEILPSLPAYGPMYVPVTDDGEPFYSEGFPVRFYRTDGTEWVANFDTGWTHLNQIIEFENSSNLLVIACGTCYLMNPDNSIPIAVFGGSYSHIFKASNNRFVLQDDIYLTIIEPDGAYWDTERISWNGLKELTAEGNIVSGFCFDVTNEAEEWVWFSYDLDTKILTGGS